MSCDLISDLPGWFMLAGWVLLPVALVAIVVAVRVLRTAQRQLELADDRLVVAEKLSSLLPYAPEGGDH